MDRRPYGVCWNSYGRAYRAVSTQNYDSLISIAYSRADCWICLYTVRWSSCIFLRRDLPGCHEVITPPHCQLSCFCITLWTTVNAKLTIRYLNMHMDDSVSVADISADWGISSSKIHLRRHFVFVLCALVWFVPIVWYVMKVKMFNCVDLILQGILRCSAYNILPFGAYELWLNQMISYIWKVMIRERLTAHITNWNTLQYCWKLWLH